VYNRYIPQSDGSYRRSRVQEQRSEGNKQSPKADTPQQTCQTEPPCYTAPISEKPYRPTPSGTNVEGFLRQLLPKDFDTGDLLVILLLLLMSGDSKENQNTALLTLALYLYM